MKTSLFVARSSLLKHPDWTPDEFVTRVVFVLIKTGLSSGAAELDAEELADTYTEEALRIALEHAVLASSPRGPYTPSTPGPRTKNADLELLPGPDFKDRAEVIADFKRFLAARAFSWPFRAVGEPMLGASSEEGEPTKYSWLLPAEYGAPSAGVDTGTAVAERQAIDRMEQVLNNNRPSTGDQKEAA